MILRLSLVCLALGTLGISTAGAQDFGIMESAETIQRGNFKVAAHPMFILGDDGADDDVGLVVRGGYGFTDRLDAELGAAFYDGLTLLGGNVELALVRSLGSTPGSGFDLSVLGGAHLATGDGADATGLDLAAIISTHLTSRAELVAALDFNRTFLDEPAEDFNTLHLVPGLEYRIADTLDFLAEFGLALGDNGANYLSAGLAFYVR